MEVDLASITPGNLLYKYADDTYLIIPAYNCHSRCAELDHIDTWAGRNNLRLNRATCAEIVFTERRRRRPVNYPPPCLPDLVHVSSIKILGVTITSKLSVSDHVNSVMSSCAQSMHALRTLRSHGMDTELLQTVYRAVIIAKLLYASSARWGFTTASDIQRLEASLRRAQRSGLYPTDKPTLTQLAEDADYTLFRTIITPSIMFYTVSYLSELTTHTILDLGLIILNLVLA